MSGAGDLDLRFPIGGLFVVLGAILLGYGVITSGDTSMYERSADINVNLWWGAVMLLVGALFLSFAARASKVSARG